ncbi:MAG: iron-containing alcohol dehydrogenase [Bacteroidetes bacterium]|nr:iron-containing alcohol dehydrogenase [Bacteroidota bacterium]
MINFEFYNPTRIIFGKDAILKLGRELSRYGNKVLVITGGGSAKRSGLLDHALRILKENNKQVWILDGIKPNPRLDSVYEGIKMCKTRQVELILAIGGGSVIDAAKAIAVGAATQHDIWDFYLRKLSVTKALPLGCMLTLAATGTEMNGNSVVTKWETREKNFISGSALFPKFSILDPTYTLTVPRDQTANGCVDMMVHVFEQYFSHTTDTPLQDRLCEGLMKTIIENALILAADPQDYTVRANILWCGTMALNELVGMGKKQDWATHIIEHELSAEYDIAHGAGLAILSPNWMAYVYKENKALFRQFAERVWDIQGNGKSEEEIILEGIRKTREFFVSIGAPATLEDAGIDESKISLMAARAVRFGPVGSMKKLGKEDVETILRNALV